jgi:hypothetical protein
MTNIMTTSLTSLFNIETYLWIASLAALVCVTLCAFPTLRRNLNDDTHAIHTHHDRLQCALRNTKHQEQEITQQILDAGHAIRMAHTTTVRHIAHSRQILNSRPSHQTHTPSDEILIKLSIFQHISQTCQDPRPPLAHEIDLAFRLMEH